MGFYGMVGLMRDVMERAKQFILVCQICMLFLVLSSPGRAEMPSSGNAPGASVEGSGRIVYVPVYSHIFTGDKGAPFLLAVTVLVRNTDLHRSIQVLSADYHDSSGNLLRRFVTEPVRLPPLATAHFIIPESERAGGAGANVVVTWKASRAVSPPIIESVMIGTRGQQGISFTSRGQDIVLPAPSPASSPASLSGDGPALNQP